MKVRPIKFNRSMVQAILEGRKTQTRRIIEIQPDDHHIDIVLLEDGDGTNNRSLEYWIKDLTPGDTVIPKYQIGDFLWVRDTFLKVTDLRVERLQDITKEDAIAEGIIDSRPFGFRFNATSQYESAKEAFAGLWESIYGPGAWEQNPLVWVYEFEKAPNPYFSKN